MSLQTDLEKILLPILSRQLDPDYAKDYTNEAVSKIVEVVKRKEEEPQ